ncbi:MAG: methionine biosynthesis protein MetW, partial [Candidatus Paceibacterota bacterium]
MNETHSTPNEIADLIKDIIQDKIVCDVGCGDGTFMQALSKYAKAVIGIEYDPKNWKVATKKGLNVFFYDTFFVPLHTYTTPPPDVYYLWTRDCMGVYLKAKEEGTHGTFIFGPSARPSTKAFLNLLDAEVRETKIPFG